MALAVLANMGLQGVNMDQMDRMPDDDGSPNGEDTQVLLSGGSGPLLNVREAAGYLRVSTQTIYDDVAAGRLPCIRIGKRILIYRPLLDAMLHEEALRSWEHPAKELALCARYRKASEGAA